MQNYINHTPHAIECRFNGEVILRVEKSKLTLRLGYQRINKAVQEPRIDEIHYLPKGLPRLLPGTLRIVSRDVREAFTWRPDFVSVSDPIKTQRGDVIACKKFLGNAGVDAWAVMKPCAQVVALFWPHRDELKLAHQLTRSLSADMLILNLMDRMENSISGAVNIPPGKYQARFLTESLPRGCRIAYLGQLPKSLRGQACATWRDLSALTTAELQSGRTTALA